MPRAKPIKCPIELGGCNTVCIEIRWHYPKPICEPNVKRLYNEYRYVCPKCGKEWVYDTLWREIAEVPEDANFHFDKHSDLIKV
ncbi:MAG: hypothetical protein IB616_01265 [Methanosarcinales archaeon]|nr:MAG: hypothetical protein IB616_01265 [Methanosarcinales archaeon]